MAPEVIQSRLNQYQGDDLAREKMLWKLFSEAGCGNNLSEQFLPKRKEPNVICTLPGETEERIVVGAHFDHSPKGQGVIDNWSGAALLPSLLQSLIGVRRKHTFVFVGFTGEEKGLAGSFFYVEHLSKTALENMKLMVTMDSLGAGPTKVWVSRSDKMAVAWLGGVAQNLNLPLEGSNLDGVGLSDEEPFLRRDVRVVVVHSLTTNNFRLLHGKLDAPEAIKFKDYYDTYQLMAAYLAVLDAQMEDRSNQSQTK